MERTKNESKFKYKLPAKASLYYVASTVIGKVVGVLTTPLFTRALDTEQFGAYSYYISILSIVSLLSGVFLTPAVIYSAFGRFRDEKEKIKAAAISLSSFFSILICLVLFTLNDFFEIKREFVIFILLQCIFDSAVNAELLAGKYSYDYISVITLNLISSLLSPIISLFLISGLGMQAEGRILGMLISGGVVFSLVLIKNLRELSLPRGRNLIFLFSSAVTLLPSVIARASLGWSDKLLVKAALGSAELAKYSVAHTVGMALFALIGALSSALNPWIIRKLSSKNDAAILPVLKTLCEMIAYASVIVAGLGREILAFLAPPSYLDLALVTVPFAAATLPYFAFGVIGVILTYYGRERFVSFSAIFGAALNLAANVLLIPRLGAIGGALSYFLSETVMYALSLKQLSAVRRDVSQGLFSPIAFLFSICASAVLATLYDRLALRLLLLIPPALLLTARCFECLKLLGEGNEGKNPRKDDQE